MSIAGVSSGVAEVPRVDLRRPHAAIDGPPLWDGGASERIADVIERALAANEPRSRHDGVPDESLWSAQWPA